MRFEDEVVKIFEPGFRLYQSSSKHSALCNSSQKRRLQLDILEWNILLPGQTALC